MPEAQFGGPKFAILNMDFYTKLRPTTKVNKNL
jgi:hypothetical protein